MLFVLVFALLLVASPVLANPACAVCTVAVAASLEIARKFGVDDSVVGVWAGGLLVMVGYWTIAWFEKKNWSFAGRDFWLISLSVAMIGFIYISHMVYSPTVILWIVYLDPFLFSTIVGALVFHYANNFYQWMKAKNGGRAHFPFEKVVVPVLALCFCSVYFYYFPLCLGL